MQKLFNSALGQSITAVTRRGLAADKPPIEDWKNRSFAARWKRKSLDPPTARLTSLLLPCGQLDQSGTKESTSRRRLSPSSRVLLALLKDSNDKDCSELK